MTKIMLTVMITTVSLPGKTQGKGKGLNCEHFTQQGPMRCREE